MALHNEGLIDVVGAFESLKNKSSNGPDFFLTRHVFEKALPDLDAPVPSVMRCVLRLYRGAGQDLAAGTIFKGFIDFCEKDPARPREALAEIEASPDNFADLLPGTLITGSRIDNPFYLAQAIRLCEDKNIELRRRAVFSLGKFNWPEDIAASDSALAALERSATAETDDQILAGIVKSAFALLRQHKAQEPRVVALIATALSKGDEYTLYAASEVFGFHTGELTATLRDALFVHLVGVKSTNKSTLDNVDYGISHLLKNGDPEKAIQCLEALLLTHPDELTMEVFDSAAREILSNKVLISKVLTRWFLRGDRVLCNGVHTIIGVHHGNDLPLEIDPAELKPADFVHILFVARKAIGYLFMQPISAATVLISLMRNTTDDEVLTELGVLLFNPLLLNFTGKAREYVVQQSGLESVKVKATIDQALKAIDNYLEDLRSVGNLAALHPGETQREAHHRHFSRLMAESWKAAEAQSVFLNLVSKTYCSMGESRSVTWTVPMGSPIEWKSHYRVTALKWNFHEWRISTPSGWITCCEFQKRTAPRMKLILKEYLSYLRERGELDAILPDLLSQLGLNVFSRPGRGTRQDGVDVGAVGSLDGGPERVYLFSIKPGDLTRKDWDGDAVQSLRPSLNEIIDAYIPNRLPAEHRGKDIVICIGIGGDVQEQVRLPLAGFIKRNTTASLTFEEWNGDKLAALIQSCFLREDLLPAHARSRLRKSLALLDEPEASYQHFAALIKSLATVDNQKDAERVTALRQMSICLWILFAWARETANMGLLTWRAN